jgi:hypothetical protein
MGRKGRHSAKFCSAFVGQWAVRVLLLGQGLGVLNKIGFHGNSFPTSELTGVADV